MFNKLRQRVRNYIITWICCNVVIGGHCGLCGRWVPDCLVSYWWRVTICDRCIGGK